MSKVVLITGASSGIGKSIGEYLDHKNYKVYGTSRHPENYKNIPFELLPLDVRDEELIKKCIDFVFEAEGKIDVLINNAGVGITGPLEEIPMQEIKNQFEVNFFGPIAVIKAVLPYMRQQKNGLIINVTSIAGYMGLPYRAPYSASKGAFGLVSDALRLEVEEFGISITNVAPGDFDTNIAAGRFHAPLNNNSDYNETYSKVLNSINAHVKEGENPIKIAKKVEKIIKSKHIKSSYKVASFLQKQASIIKMILPSKLFENILKKNQGMS